MITANVYHRVFQIITERTTGTAFAFEHESRQYLCTAKHVISGASNKSVRISRIGKTVPLDIAARWESNTADVAVISLKNRIAPILPMPMESAKFTFGQDAYFLGFPYGITWMPRPDINYGFPLPLVKKAIVSGEIEVEGRVMLVLDGHNNEGFSGGPVVLRPPGSKEFHTVGIVVSYRVHELVVCDTTNREIGVARSNSGLMFADNIQHAIEGARTLGDGAALT